jgi:O-antigen/teichoic acid export membrane protein
MFAMGLGVVSAAIQARILGPEGRGELATAIVPGTVMAMLLCLGLPDYFARRAAKDGDGRQSAKLALVLSSAIGCLVIWPYVLGVGLVAPPESHAWWLLVIFACLTPVFIYGYCLVAISMGLSHWYFVATSKILPQLITVVGLTVMLFDGADALSVGFLLIASALSGLLFPLLGKAMRPKGHVRWEDAQHAMSFGLRGWTTGALGLLNQRIDLLLLTVMASKSDLGYYAVATTVASVLNAVSTAVGVPARNRVAKGDTEGTAATVALVICLTSVACLILCLNLSWIVPLVLGSQFVAAIPVMWVLAFAQVPLSGVVVLTFSLVGLGRPAAPIIGEAIALATTTASILIFFPLFGITAAAVANLVGNCLSLLALLFLAKRYLSKASLWRYIFLTPAHAKLLISSISPE